MSLFCQRRVPEILDQPGVDPQDHRRALTGLARINLLSASAGSFFKPLLQLHQRLGTTKLRILDVACGGGDVTRRLWLQAVRRGLDWRVAGCDISPIAIAFAREQAQRAGALVHYFTHDLLARPLECSFDAIVCSLFLHHLDRDRATQLLRTMAGPAEGGPRMILVNDLDRCLFGVSLAYVVPRLLTLCPIVHSDAVSSVHAAYTPGEALGLAGEAGLPGASVVRCWPARWLLKWSRP